ncbi:MAG: hypothetical protein AVDCRST_MAG76-3389 [uncultured Acidimicrobiales bacterium]|uniref:Nucleotidyltransferase family protein n=1 Tax=uncultured Acidimicrobiales bacterium TaxID=310071 RepID=A0A6J4J5Y7_9ACTN|nr:MAG: hypothetical protein AVDCRST_MAG76-3389 [uncultured Acidimicrobiales bacterium]
MAGPHPALLDLAADRPLARQVDWDRLVASAVEHRMGGLLWSRVRTGEIHCPTVWKEQLAGADVVVRSRHRRIWEALASVNRRLGALDVEFAVIKGVPAEARWYARAGERPCRDLDLLIGPGDVGRIGEVLAALDPEHELRDHAAELVELGLVQSFDLVVDGMAVDLHVDLFKLGPPCRHPERLFARTVPLVLPDGGTVRAVDAELSLVHFLLHLNRDSYCWLLGFADVARLLAGEDLDWEAIGRLVADEGLEAPVWGGLNAVTTTLGVPAPSRSPQGCRASLWRALWRPSVRLQGDMGWVRYRRRPNWLPVVVDMGLPPVIAWSWRQLVLSPTLVAHTNPGRRGPWWWRLIRGRWGRAVERRRAVRRLR